MAMVGGLDDLVDDTEDHAVGEGTGRDAMEVDGVDGEQVTARDVEKILHLVKMKRRQKREAAAANTGTGTLNPKP